MGYLFFHGPGPLVNISHVALSSNDGLLIAELGLQMSALHFRQTLSNLMLCVCVCVCVCMHACVCVCDRVLVPSPGTVSNIQCTLLRNLLHLLLPSHELCIIFLPCL